MKNVIIEQDIKNILSHLRIELPKLSGKTLLISGGAGFIGYYILRVILQANRKYLKKKCKVISVDNYITGSRKHVFENNDFQFIEHDIRQPLPIKVEIDYIIHAAGLASPIYYKKYPLETLETAVLGTQNLLKLAQKKKIKSFLFFSSSEIYGDPDAASIPTSESYKGNVSSIGARACYDESKRLGETLCMIYCQKYRVPIKIVRPFNIYGPGMKKNDYRVIPTFINHGLEGKYLPVHDKGNQTRTFCYIADAVNGFFKVLLSGKIGEVYNVGNDQNEINMMSLAQIVAQLCLNKVEVHMVSYPNTYPVDEPKRRCPDLTKIRSTLGYRPAVDLMEGLKRTLQWYKNEYYP